MRAIGATLSLILLTGPATAWEFTALPVCTLSHEGAEAAVTVIYDPRLDEPYAITLRRTEGWTAGPVFALAFTGGRSLTISTDRHRTSPDRTGITVTDRGFGNLLDGLEFNGEATALIADQAVTFSLDGAAEPVRDFRACTEGGLA